MNKYKTLILASSMALAAPLSWGQQANSTATTVAKSWAGSYIGVTLGNSQGERRRASTGSSATNQSDANPSNAYCWNTSSNSTIPGQTTEASCLTSGKPGTHVWFPAGTPNPDVNNASSFSGEQSSTRSRNTFGLKGGHNWQETGERTVYGVELDYTHLHNDDSVVSASSTAAVISPPTSLTTASTMKGGIHWLSTLRGRIGYASEDNAWLPYLTAGLAWGRLATQGTASYASSIGSNVTNSFNESSVKSGYVYGIGLDYRIDQNLVLNLSYMRAKLGSTRSFLDGNASTNGNQATAGTAYGSIDPYVNLAAIGLSYKFD